MKKLRNLSRIDVLLFIGFSVLLALLFFRTNSDNGKNSNKEEVSIWPIVITIVVISIIIYFILKKNIPKLSKKDTKGDSTEKVKIDKDKVPSFKTNARWSSAKDWVVGIIVVVIIFFAVLCNYDKKCADKVVTTTSQPDQSGIKKIEECLPGSYIITVPANGMTPVRIGFHKSMEYLSQFHTGYVADSTGKNVDGANSEKFADNIFFVNPANVPQIIWFTIRDKTRQ